MAQVKKWHKLDNTAHLFPVIASRRMTNVFRMTAVLTEDVAPQLLQQALEDTLPLFAAFSVRLRHGLFWSYLEQNDAPARLQPEQDAPCRYIDPLVTGRYLFRLLYFGPRISLETFHVLTDGVGAMRFLKALCYRYLQLAHPGEVPRGTRFGVEQAGNVQDGYIKHYTPQKNWSTYRETPAYRIRGELRPSFELGVCTALMPLDALKAQCAGLGASVGEYLAALLALAVYEEHMPAAGSTRPVSIFVPVDLRRVFGTDTSANFFSGFSARVPFSGPRAPEEVIRILKPQFAEKKTPAAFRDKLAYTARSEVDLAIRMVPLPVKNGILRIIYQRSNRGSTMTLSNLGKVDVEPDFAPFFAGFRFLLGATPGEPLKCTACSYQTPSGPQLALTMTSLLTGTAAARNIVRRLTAAGVPVTVESAGETE